MRNPTKIIRSRMRAFEIEPNDKTLSQIVHEVYDIFFDTVRFKEVSTKKQIEALNTLAGLIAIFELDEESDS